MSRLIQLVIGTPYGRLETIGPTFAKQLGKQCYGHVPCRCSCGVECVKLVKHLLSGKTQSCGCLRKELSGARSRQRAADKRKDARNGEENTAQSAVSNGAAVY